MPGWRCCRSRTSSGRRWTAWPGSWTAGRWRSRFPPDLPPVAADAIFIDQVLTNLLENAMRHAPPDVPIRVVGAVTSSQYRSPVRGGRRTWRAGGDRSIACSTSSTGCRRHASARDVAAGSAWPWFAGSSRRWAAASRPAPSEPRRARRGRRARGGPGVDTAGRTGRAPRRGTTVMPDQRPGAAVLLVEDDAGDAPRGRRVPAGSRLQGRRGGRRRDGLGSLDRGAAGRGGPRPGPAGHRRVRADPPPAARCDHARSWCSPPAIGKATRSLRWSRAPTTT